METVRSWTDGDLRRLDEIIVEGERRFKERQPRSGALIGEARGVLAGGATSSWQIARPQMIWVSHGEGSKIYDADGGEYVDLHGGYGVGAVGHGHPEDRRGLDAEGSAGDALRPADGGCYRRG